MRVKPKLVILLGIEYQVIYVDRPSDVDIFKREALWGQIDYWTRTIRIYDGGRSWADIFQNLMHELLHGITNDLHLASLAKAEHHAELDILALALVDTFVRNDWITFDFAETEINVSTGRSAL